MNTKICIMKNDFKKRHKADFVRLGHIYMGIKCITMPI